MISTQNVRKRKHFQETIGRDSDLKQLTLAANKAPGSASEWFYLVGVGGMGKTNLIQNLEEYIRDHTSPQTPLISAFVDFQSPDVWLVEGLMDKIVDGLRKFIPDPVGDQPDPFRDFEEALVQRMLVQRDQYPQEKIEELKYKVYSTFKACYEAFAEQYRIVLLFDTVEELDRMDVPRDPEVRTIFEDLLLHLPGTLFVLSGRDRDRIEAGRTYQWFRPAAEGGLRLPAPLTEQIDILELNEENAKHFLSQLLQTTELPAHLITILPKVHELLGYNPIYLVLLTERYDRLMPLVEDDLRDAETLRKALVRAYFHAAGSDDVLLYMALGPYHFDVAMIEATTRESTKSSTAKFKALEAERFVRFFVDTNTILLHDEMRDLLRDYIWRDRYPDNTTIRCVLRDILHRHFTMQEEVQQKIAEKIATLQEEMELDNVFRRVPLPADSDPPRRAQVSAEPTMLSDKEREAVAQTWIDQRRLELREEILVREMQHLLESLAQEAATEADHTQDYVEEIEVFDRRWKLLRSVSGDIFHKRKELLADIKKKEPRPGWLLEDPMESPKAVIRYHRRRIDMEYEYEKHFKTAEEEYQKLLERLEKSRLSAIEQAEWKVQLLLWKGNATVRRTDTKANLSQAKATWREAWEICIASDSRLHQYRAQVANVLGWVNRMQWNLEEARGWYEDALENISEEKTDPHNRLLNFTQILNNLGYVYRYTDPYKGLQYSDLAYRLQAQMRRQSHVVRSLRTLSILHRFNGNYERAFDLAQRALDLATTLQRPDAQALGHLQLACTWWYAYANETPANRENSYLEAARQHLITAQETLEKQQYRDDYYLVSELIHTYYILGHVTHILAGYETARDYLEQGIDLARKIGDDYRQINGQRLLIELVYQHTRAQDEFDLTYNQFCQLPEYLEICSRIKYNTTLETNASLFLAKVARVAGAVALHDALHNGRLDLFDKSIEHFIDAFERFTLEKGYWTVILQSELQGLSRYFDELLRAATAGDSRYVNILLDWCRRFEDHWTQEARCEGKQKLEQTIPHVFNLTRVYRTKILFGQQTLLPTHSWQYMAYIANSIDRALDDEAYVVINSLLSYMKEDGLDYLRLDKLPACLQLREAELGLATGKDRSSYNILKQLYQSFCEPISSSSAPQCRASVAFAPDHLQAEWHNQSLTETEWIRLMVALGRIQLRLPVEEDVSYQPDSFDLLCTSVTMSRYIKKLRGRTKFYLARALRGHGYLSEATRLLEVALEECSQDGDRQFAALCLNQLARYVALQGNDQSALLYAQQALDMTIEQGHTRNVYEGYISIANVYRSWGGYSVSRGSTGLVNDLYAKSELYLQKAENWLQQTNRDDPKSNIALELGITCRRRGIAELRNQNVPQAEKYLQAAENYLNRALSTTPSSYEEAEIRNALGHTLHDQAIPASRTPFDQSSVMDLLKRAISQFERSLELATRTSRYSLIVNNLAALVEINYIFTHSRPDRELFFKLLHDSSEERSRSRYQQARQDPYVEKLKQLKDTLGVSISRCAGMPWFDDNAVSPPSGVRHWYGRVELVLGLLAQWEGNLRAGLQHYSLGARLIATSCHASFNIDTTLEFLAERFNELGDLGLRRDWAEQLLADWRSEDVIRNRYPDMITFCELEIRQAQLKLESRIVAS